MAGKAAATLGWLKGNLLHRADDTAAVALVLEGLTRLAPEERAPYVVFMRNLRRLLLVEQRADGSWSSVRATHTRAHKHGHANRLHCRQYTRARPYHRRP